VCSSDLKEKFYKARSRVRDRKNESDA